MINYVLGKQPQKVNLQSNILEDIDCGKYVRRKVSYYSEENEIVTAYLGIPKNMDRKLPAVFCYHQHAGNYDLGKSEVFGISGDKNQAYAHELSNKGFITFAPDALGFEDRKMCKEGEPYFYVMQDMLRRMVESGCSPLGKTLFDISIGIDFLSSVENVDINRIGFIGHSYGGRMALWAPAFDERIKVSVSNCGCVSQKDSIKNNTGLQVDVCGFGMLDKNLDVEDAVKLISPRYLYISATKGDKYSYGAENLYKAVKSEYKEGSLLFNLYDGGHVFTDEMRSNAYKFIEDNL